MIDDSSSTNMFPYSYRQTVNEDKIKSKPRVQVPNNEHYNLFECQLYFTVVCARGYRGKKREVKKKQKNYTKSLGRHE